MLVPSHLQVQSLIDTGLRRQEFEFGHRWHVSGRRDLVA